MFDFSKPSKSIAKTIFIVFSILLSSHLNASIQEQKLIASDGAMVDLFGGSVSISGDYAVVGANQVEINGDRTGAAYVFEHDGNSWVEKAKLIPPQAFENYGGSVSISGNRLVVGATNAIVSPHQFAGAAYIYHRDVNGNWIFIERIQASDVAFGDRFGKSVSIDGDQIIVGAYQNDDVVSGSGAAYVFDYINNGWTESQILLASDPLLNDHFGTAVKIEGNRAIIGASDADVLVAGDNIGKVYVFEKNGDTWSETHTFTAGTDVGSGDLFGADISLSGDRVIIGASSNADAGIRSGSAYVFEYSSAMTTWNSGQKLTAFDAAAYDRFGASVAISGNKMLIGAPSNDEMETESGSVYSYYHDGNSWIFLERILHTDTPRFTDKFGNSIALDGNRSIIGSYNDDRDQTNAYNSGAAYIFNHDIAPVAVGDSASMNEGSGIIFISVLSNDTDVDGGTKFIESYLPAANGTVSQSGPRLSYSPDSNYCNDGNTTDDFTYRTNGGSQATVSITVTCFNDLPEAAEDYINITEDDMVTVIDVLANDFDSDGGDEMLIGSVTQANNGTVIFTATDLSYTPDADYCNNSSTLDTFTYTLTTGSTTDVSIMVACINDAPSFNVSGDINANGNVLFDLTEFSAPGFINSISFGPANESSQQVLQYIVSVTSDSASVINTIDISNTGTLIIDFTLNQGVAIIGVVLRDNGGTSDGGVDTSDTLMFNVIFTDKMFNDSFEENVVVQSMNKLSLKNTKSSPHEITVDHESKVVIFKNHMVELNDENSYQETLRMIDMWIDEINQLIPD